jgi:nudix-type nucleoside diphosphatase (YffH/AdpP family)
MKIVNQEIVYNGKLLVESGTIKHKKQVFSRERIKREDAVAVLLLNTDRNVIILTSQFRYPVAEREKLNILEIPAGKIDAGESPEKTAIREIEEETGYRLKHSDLQPLLSCYASPGYSSEKFHLFFALVSDKDKVSESYGLEEENEYIKIVEIKVKDLESLIRQGKILDTKTNLAGLYFIAYLKSKWVK